MVHGFTDASSPPPEETGEAESQSRAILGAEGSAPRPYPPLSPLMKNPPILTIISRPKAPPPRTPLHHLPRANRILPHRPKPPPACLPPPSLLRTSRTIHLGGPEPLRASLGLGLLRRVVQERAPRLGDAAAGPPATGPPAAGPALTAAAAAIVAGVVVGVAVAILPLPPATLVGLAPPLEGPLRQRRVKRLGERRLVEAEALGALGLLGRAVVLDHAEALRALLALARLLVGGGGGEVEGVLARLLGGLLDGLLGAVRRGLALGCLGSCGRVLGRLGGLGGLRGGGGIGGGGLGRGGGLGLRGLGGDGDLVVRVVNLVFGGYAKVLASFFADEVRSTRALTMRLRGKFGRW